MTHLELLDKELERLHNLYLSDKFFSGEKEKILDLIQELHKLIVLYNTEKIIIKDTALEPAISPLIPYDICQHEYPTPWYGTVPPACKKCGKQSPIWGITTFSVNSSNTIPNPDSITLTQNGVTKEVTSGVVHT